MIKFSKATLFILMVSMCVLGGVSFAVIDWDIIETGKGIDIYNEIDLPIIFLLLAFSFMLPYVKKVKEEQQSKNN